jgi:hypothetical protein
MARSERIDEMKALSLCFLCFLFAGLLAAGCGKQETPAAGSTNTTANTGSGNPLTAPVDYLSAAAKAQKSASKTILDAGLDQAIKLFYAEQGRFPNDLKELTPQYLPAIPPAPAGMKYSYDAKSGVVKVVTQ